MHQNRKVTPRDCRYHSMALDACGIRVTEKSQDTKTPEMTVSTRSHV